MSAIELSVAADPAADVDEIVRQSMKLMVRTSIGRIRIVMVHGDGLPVSVAFDQDTTAGELKDRIVSAMRAMNQL